MENKIELKIILKGEALEKFMFMKEALEVSSDKQLLQKCFGTVFHILKNPDKINFEIRKGDFTPKNSITNKK